MSADTVTRTFTISGVGGGTSESGMVTVGAEGIDGDDYMTYYISAENAPRTGETVTVTIQRNNEHDR